MLGKFFCIRRLTHSGGRMPKHCTAFTRQVLHRLLSSVGLVLICAGCARTLPAKRAGGRAESESASCPVLSGAVARPPTAQPVRKLQDPLRESAGHPVIGYLEVRGAMVTVMGAPAGPVYTVADEDGTVLGVDLSAAELRASFPNVARRVRQGSRARVGDVDVDYGPMLQVGDSVVIEIKHGADRRTVRFQRRIGAGGTIELLEIGGRRPAPVEAARCSLGRVVEAVSRSYSEVGVSADLVGVTCSGPERRDHDRPESGRGMLLDRRIPDSEE